MPKSAPTLRRRTIGFKIRATLIGIGLLTTLLTAGLSYYLASRELKKTTFDRLNSLRTTLQDSVQTYFRDARADLASMSESQTIHNALTDLSAARRNLLPEMAAKGAPLTDDTTSLVRSTVRKYYQDVLLANLTQVRHADPGTPESYQHKDTEANLLQYFYTATNPAAIGSKFLNTTVEEIKKYPAADPALRDAFTQTSYARQHETYHTILTAHRLRFGYYDIFIVDPDGFVIYTNFKELDFQGNLKYGPERSTGLGQAYQLAMDSPPAPDGQPQVSITDLAPYPKSYDAPAIFISTPILSPSGAKAGVLIYQLPLNRINNIMTFDQLRSQIGLGDTGEAYLIGQNQIMRTDSRFLPTLPERDPAGQLNFLPTIAPNGQNQSRTTMGVLKINTPAATRALAGLRQTDQYQNYLGSHVLGSYAKLDIPGLDWAIILEQSEDEALAPAQRILVAILIAGLAVIITIVLLGAWLTRTLSRPIEALGLAMTKVSEGDESVRAPVTSRDEIGQLSETFNTMVAERAAARQQSNIETERLQNNIEDLLLVVADASDGKLSIRAKVTEGALGNIASALNIMLENVSELIERSRVASSRLTNASIEIASSAGDLTSGATLQSQEISKTVTEVSNLAKEARTVADSSRAAADAASLTRSAADRGAAAVAEMRETMHQIRDKVQVTSQKIKRLGERSMEISSIVKSISDISAQTDMLAFNASVESERGGEGRGFNLVADRVRDLAERTKQATIEIERLVVSIQSETAEAVVQMEKMTQEVENGNLKVQTAGDSLSNIVQASGRSSELVTFISDVAAIQDSHAKSILDAMTTINRIAETAQLKILGTRRTSEQLAELSSELNDRLSSFDTSQN